MKKILVTGGAGFIGSHLVEKLLEDGDKVTVIDNLHTGHRKNLPEHKNLKVYTTNILDSLGHYFKGGFDIVYHLAALTRPQESILDPGMTTIVNVQGTLQVLEQCKKYDVKRIVFVSTTGIYGEQKKLPIHETAISNPMSPYTLTKLVGEQYCQLYAKMDGLEYNIIRPFNVYGPRQSPRGGYAAAVPTFIDTLNKSGTPFITGNGKQSRDFVYVSDIVNLIVLAGRSKVCNEIFNGGSGESTSINDIYSMISTSMGVNVKPDYVDPVYEPERTLGDIYRAEALLGWIPEVSLREGIKLTIKETI